MAPSQSLNVGIFLKYSEIIALMGGGAKVGGCSSVHMAKLKTFQRTSFWLVVSLCGVYINNLWAFLLAGSHYQPQRLHQRQTCHSGSSRKDMKIYRVCLSAQGQSEGLRLSALLGKAAAQQAPHIYVWKLCSLLCCVETQTLTWVLHTFSFI